MAKKLIRKYTKDCCGYEALCDGEKILVSGDTYHDKIEEKIDGYLQALEDNDIDHTVKWKEIKCPYGCDD